VFKVKPLILLLAFIAVAIAAWLLGRRTARARAVTLPRDYYDGLQHLINDRFDRAADVFASVAERDRDATATEIQFALGSLFRRRGEVDRAIAIHSRLKEAGPPAVREAATYALALDHMSAGLMDRAEGLFDELSSSIHYRNAALGQLVRLHEQQGDWSNALRVHQLLAPAERDARRRAAAHYVCELAEDALTAGDSRQARTLLRQARDHEPQLPRADLLAARIAELDGDVAAAKAACIELAARFPRLALEMVPRVLALAGCEGRTAALDQLAGLLADRAGMSPRQVAWLLVAAVPPEYLGEASRVVERFFGSVTAAEAHALGSVLTRIGDAGGRYLCEDCGLASARWYWQCPKCREWDRLHPAVFRWAGQDGATNRTDTPDSHIGAAGRAA
jgi:lipopolysaccharide assembly protein B